MGDGHHSCIFHMHVTYTCIIAWPDNENKAKVFTRRWRLKISNKGCLMPGHMGQFRSGSNFSTGLAPLLKKHKWTNCNQEILSRLGNCPVWSGYQAGANVSTMGLVFPSPSWSAGSNLSLVFDHTKSPCRNVNSSPRHPPYNYCWFCLSDSLEFMPCMHEWVCC